MWQRQHSEQEQGAQRSKGEHQAAGVMLRWNRAKPIPRDGHHDPATGGIGTASPDRSVCGECLIRPVFVIYPLQHQHWLNM